MQQIRYSTDGREFTAIRWRVAKEIDDVSFAVHDEGEY